MDNNLTTSEIWDCFTTQQSNIVGALTRVEYELVMNSIFMEYADNGGDIFAAIKLVLGEDI